jgi:hypothetical protein
LLRKSSELKWSSRGLLSRRQPSSANAAELSDRRGLESAVLLSEGVLLQLRIERGEVERWHGERGLWVGCGGVEKAGEGGGDAVADACDGERWGTGCCGGGGEESCSDEEGRSGCGEARSVEKKGGGEKGERRRKSARRSYLAMM